jgi:predicted  nucleic acid-binding Zn-ribbon protein
MTELDEAITRAEKDLAETRTAIAAARGTTVETLASALLALQDEWAALEEKARVLDTELELLRDEEKQKLAELEAP